MKKTLFIYSVLIFVNKFYAQDFQSLVALEMLKAIEERESGIEVVASLPPTNWSSASKFLGEEIVFEGDSMWVVEGVDVIGSFLPASPPFAEYRSTSGKFVVVSYSVVNRTRKVERILQSPTLENDLGDEYRAIDMQSVYLRGLFRDTSIELEQLPPGVKKTFSAIYELPADNRILTFKAREIRSLTPNTIAVFMVSRDLVSNVGKREDLRTDRIPESSLPGAREARSDSSLVDFHNRGLMHASGEGGGNPILSQLKSLKVNWSDCGDGGWLVFKSANSSLIGIFEIA